MATLELGCETDFDCPGGLVCYSGEESWVEGSRFESLNSSFCDCSGFYGWTGENCDQLGAAAVSVAIFSIGAVILLITLPFITRELVLTFSVRVVFNAASTSMILVFLANCLFLVQIGFRLAMLTQPENNTRRNPGNSQDKFASYAIEEVLVIPIAAALGISSSLNVSLLWLEVADRAKSMKGKTANNLQTYRNPIIVSQSIYIVTTLIAVILGQPAIATLISIPFIFAVMTSFTLGAWRLTSLLKQSSTFSNGSSAGEIKVNKRTMKTIQLIRRVTIYLSMFMLLALISALVYISTTLSGWREYAPPGSISITEITNALLLFSIYGIVVIITYYLYKTGRRRRKAAKGEVDTISSTDNTNDKSGKAFVPTTSAVVPKGESEAVSGFGDPQPSSS